MRNAEIGDTNPRVLRESLRQSYGPDHQCKWKRVLFPGR